MYGHAIVRKPGRNFAEGISTSGLGRPDFIKASLQHEAYREALRKSGLDITVLEADEHYPDGCFVEDTAVVTDEVAIIANPGASSRQGEEKGIAELLGRYKTVEKIVFPGTLDGGDILRAGDHFYIGVSARTNPAGARQLSAILSKYGYSSSEIIVAEGLHLKSGIASLGNGIFISVPQFAHDVTAANVILLDQEESYSANCLVINGNLLIPAGFPKSRRQLAGLGYNLLDLDMSEFRKMDGGLTCLSLIF